MKIDKPQNLNYCATVVQIKNIVNFPNCDNVVGTTIFGSQAIVGKEVHIGDMGIFFPAESQLSDEFCYENNLYRHADKNRHEDKKGYMEDNRRIRAIKFRGNVSNCLFMPLSSLSFTKVNPDMLNVGDEFDILNGKEICRKYVVERRISNKGAMAVEKKFQRVDSKHMPEHYDTVNFFKWSETIDKEKEIIVTQKIHGTSIRIGHTITKRKLNVFELILSKVGVKILPYTHDYVYGSRKVIKDSNNPYQNHFYASDIWTREGERLKGTLPENYIVYGELVGWTQEGAEIQKNYTYSVEKCKAELYVYRIAIINNQGYVTDLSWDQVKEFCTKMGIYHVPEIWRGKMKDLVVADFIDQRLFENGYKNCLYLGENKDIFDEGVCIRVDGIIPQIFKAKSPKFLEHETKLLDANDVDIESLQSPIINFTE